jgi:hypothetical protein
VASDTSSWSSYLALGLISIAFSVAAMLLLSAGADTGRLSSWALLGFPMGLAIIAIAFYKKRKQSRR